MEELEQVRAELASAQETIAALTAERDQAASDRAVLATAHDEAIGALRGTLAGTLPEAVRGLVAGDTVAAITQSVEQARTIATTLTGQRTVVPSGGVVRQPPSTEGMAPEQILRLGISQMQR